MKLYLFPSQLPEIQHIPKEARDDLIELALHSIPITKWNLFTFSSLMLPLAGSGVVLSVEVASWFSYVYVCIGLPVIWIWWLNIARPRLKEVVAEWERWQEPESSAETMVPQE